LSVVFIPPDQWLTLLTMNYTGLLHTIRRASVLGLYLVLSIVLSSCSTVSYYSQSVVGHSRLMLARVPLDKAIENAQEPVKAKLLLSKELITFAVEQLALPSSSSYKSYVALEREFPVWTVVAAAEFSLAAKQWCYPVIGCASYRGYFNQAAAHAYADKLKSQGLETEVGGASAYSTLGWFADPLLPSMMRYGDSEFAETLFHEIAHQKLYINGDSDFNEAFASVVGETGVMRWLQANNPAGLAAYRSSLRVQHQFYLLVANSKQALQAIYQSTLTPIEMAAEKYRVFDHLRASYKALKTQQWDGQDWYRSWFDNDLNNAKFAALSTYRQRVPELRALLTKCDQSLIRFYKVLSSAKRVDHKVIVPNACPP
jgi:predicted aminopeptidase